MAISITISASKGSYNRTGGYTPVSVSVVAYYSGGSFNRNASLTVTVDGSQTNSTVSVNGSESTSSGSTIIYSEIWNIYHTTASTIYCHASLYAGGTTGTTTDSVSVSLTVPSSGGSSGEDSNDEADYGTSTNPDCPHCVRILPGEHVSIRAMHNASGVTLSDGSYVSSGWPMLVFFDADDGYIVSTHTINGETINSGGLYYIYSNITIRASATVDPMASINQSLATKIYKDCTASGLTDLYRTTIHGYTGEGGESSPTNKTNVTMTEYDINSSITLQHKFKKSSSQYDSSSYSYYRAYAIKFTIPNIDLPILSLQFKYNLYNISTLAQESDIMYTLTSADASLNDYARGYDDPYEIISGSISRSSLYTNAVSTLDIATNKLEANKSYYLILYINNMSKTSENTAELYYNNISVGCIGGIYYIDEGTAYGAYQCHIYTTTSYDVYEIYRDNGSSWDLVQN